MKSLTFTIIALLFVSTMNGQYTRLEISQLGVFSSEDYGNAKIFFNQEKQLNDIIVSKTRTTKETVSWRIRIYMGSGNKARSIATMKRNNFKTDFPDIDADLSYPAPNFKVHVGNFKTRIEAESFRRKIRNSYPNCRVEPVTLRSEK